MVRERVAATWAIDPDDRGAADDMSVALAFRCQGDQEERAAPLASNITYLIPELKDVAPGQAWYSIHAPFGWTSACHKSRHGDGKSHGRWLSLASPGSDRDGPARAVARLPPLPKEREFAFDRPLSCGRRDRPLSCGRRARGPRSPRGGGGRGAHAVSNVVRRERPRARGRAFRTPTRATSTARRVFRRCLSSSNIARGKGVC